MGLYLMSRSLSRRNLITNLRRFIHIQPSKLLVPLNSRKILQVKGTDSQEFLQGLITNDMRHLDEGARSVFAMFLNNKGRVLYDVLIHKSSTDSFLIECDKEISDALKKHLNIFKLKRAVKIQDMNSVGVWVLLSSNHKTSLPHYEDLEDGSLTVYKDPRLLHLGYRLITDVAMTAPQLIDILGTKGKKEEMQLGDLDMYKYLRYRLGIGEGSEDLPPGMCFPLEVNCDYLHGVSFHKGCYIGQEVTARVHHTGVIRKRLMPIKFSSPVKDGNFKDVIIKTNKGSDGKSNLGKLRGVVHDYGLGILRIKESLEEKTIIIGDYIGEVLKPSWWPVEAPKEINKIEN